ncbi:claudin-4-like [Mugil cephalus]|uniref:claudin-4-like n=1 Tax=Mugil cephalus TaxID=48193 RepID=UPI001FB773BD|nr:claudin-4-like [Mugil cephalus]
MVSAGLQTLGLALCITGWVGSLAACILPHWRVILFSDSNRIVSEGLWGFCFLSRDIYCIFYYPERYFSPDLLAGRALTIVSILIGSVGIPLGIAGGQCTNYLKDERSKARIRLASGIIFIIAGVFYLIAVSWITLYKSMDFAGPRFGTPREKKPGFSLFIGWFATAFFILGGAVLCVNKRTKKSSPRSSAAKNYVGGERSFVQCFLVELHVPSDASYLSLELL